MLCEEAPLQMASTEGTSSRRNEMLDCSHHTTSFGLLASTTAIAFSLTSVRSKLPIFDVVHCRRSSSRSCGVLQPQSSMRTSASKCKQLSVSERSDFRTESPSAAGVGTSNLR
eukprot:6212640-Pleurochrysis_carterae.AAC.5